MSNLLKLLIPIALGTAAAIVNFIVLSGATHEVRFVVASEDIPAGALFDGKVEEIAIPKNHATGLLEKRTGVRYKDVGVLRGQRSAFRTLKKGDIVLYSDFDIGDSGSVDFRRNDEVARTIQLDGNQIYAANIGDWIWLEIPKYSRVATNPQGDFRFDKVPEKIGPYRIIGIGSQIEAQSEGYTFNADSVTVAYGRNPKPKEIDRIKKLNDFVTDREFDVSNNLKVLGVEIMSADNYWATYKKEN